MSEQLKTGMWRIEKLFMPRLSIYDISQLSSSGVFVFLGCEPLLTKGNAEMLIKAHNKTIAQKIPFKYEEDTLRMVNRCKDFVGEKLPFEVAK